MKSGLDLYRQNRLLTDDWRHLEAEVFRRVAFGLQQSCPLGGVPRARAIADARILWAAVLDLVSDDLNRLPPQLRGDLVRLAHTLLAEMDKPVAAVDIETLISATTRVAEGLEHK